MPDPFIHLMKAGVKPGLVRIRKLLKALGHPERNFRTVLVAGSNGKGTTCAVLESILRANGQRTGLFMSPHLVSVRERFKVNGRPVPMRSLTRFVQDHGDLLERVGATYFEATTACAVWLFAQRRVDWAVLEIGLGGRWDACNAVDPELAVVTSISKEHTEYLGKTLGLIAAEKAQVARPGKPVIVGNVGRAARKSLSAEFRQIGAVPWWIGKEARVEPEKQDPEGGKFHLACDGLELELQTRLRGRKAVENSALAAAAAIRVGVPVAAVRRGVRDAFLPGRLQIVGTRPLVVVDVAHNRAAMDALTADWLAIWPKQRPVVVVGLLSDKPVMPAGWALAGIARRIVVTQPDSGRALNPEVVARRWRRLGVPVKVEPSIRNAVVTAIADTGARGSVLVCGSHYVVGPALQALGRAP